MNEIGNIIHIGYDGNEKLTVSGRELHQALEIRTPYHIWFPRMCGYGFTENSDYLTVYKNVHRADGAKMPQEQMEHELTIDMAKEICMIQRSEIGKQCRQYFLEIEKRWNSPEAIMARALKMANAKLLDAEQLIQQLETTISIQNQQIAELQPKADYYNLVLDCPDAISITAIAKEYGKSGKWLNDYLHEHGVQYKQNGIWLLYQRFANRGFTCTKAILQKDDTGRQRPKMHTYWTQKGRAFIHEGMKRDGILPVVERMKKENW